SYDDEDHTPRLEHAALAYPRAPVCGRAARPRPWGPPAREQRILAEHQVAHRQYPREQAASDQRAEQSEAGEADDVPGQHEDAVVQALANRAQLQREDREPG